MMLLWQFALRYLIRHWRLTLAALGIFTLSAGIMAGLPCYAQIIAARSLTQALEDTPPSGRNIQLTAPGATSTAALAGVVQADLGSWTSGMLEVQNVKVLAAPTGSSLVDAAHIITPNFIWAWSFDNLRGYTYLVKGAWPAYPDKPRTQRDRLKPPILEAVIGEDTARQSGYRIGDVLTAYDGTKYNIVGIIQRINPKDDIWWGDDTPFALTIEPGLNEDTFVFPVLITPKTMTDFLPVEAKSWRIKVDQSAINVNNMQAIEQGFINLKIRLEAQHAALVSNLPNLILEYRQNLGTVRMVLYLLSTQAYLFVLYTLGLVSTLFVLQSQKELATLAGRGANSMQMTLSFASGGLSLALIAGILLGPGLVRALLTAWSYMSAEPAILALPPDAWILSISTVLLGWIAFSLPIYSAARRNILDWQQHIARPDPGPGWQRINVDIFLLVFSLAVYWQLSSADSFILKRLDKTAFADPVLLLGPSFLLIALALIFLRIFPWLLRSLTWLSRVGRGFVVPLGMARLSRDPVRPGQVVLLVSLAAGLTLFARSFVDTLAVNQWESAHYQAGADLRIDLRNQKMENLSGLPGVSAATQVLRGVGQRSGGRSIAILAVDPQTFPAVIRYPPGISNLSMSRLAQALQWQPTQVLETPQPDNQYLADPYVNATSNVELVPALVSYSALGKDGKIGDQLEASLSGFPITFQVQGIITDFPTLSSSFIIANAATIQSAAGSRFNNLFLHREAWLSVNEVYYPALLQDADLAESVIADARQELHIIQGNALTQGATQAFRLNAIVLSVLSVLGFLLVFYFTTQQRSYEFNLLRAQGLSSAQLFHLLAMEGVLILLSGLLTGTFLGYGLALGMQPFLSQAIARQLPGMTMQTLTINWVETARLYGAFVIIYSMTLFLSILFLKRSGIHRVLRIADE
jgi:putative ABC transport system permease protein